MKRPGRWCGLMLLFVSGCARYPTAPGALVGGSPYSDEARYLVAMQATAEPSPAPHPGTFFLGVRGNINAGEGDPANDMPGFGVYGRYRFNDGPWLAGLAVDTSTFDVERPGEMIEITTATVTDAQLDSTTVTLWGEYELEPLAEDGFFRGVRPYVGAGVGIASVGDDTVAGPTAAGGTFNFEVEGGTEIVPGLLAGLRFDVGRHAVIDLGVRVDYHFTEMEVTDTITGARTDVDDYPTYGAYLGFQLRW